MPAVGAALRVQAAGAGEDLRTAVGGIAGIEHHQAGVVHPPVGIDEAARKAGLERPARRMLRQPDRLRAGQKAPARQVVI